MESLPGSFSSIIEKRPYIYDPKVWNKASTEATMHNFPYSFDQVILKSRPLIKSGGYQIYRLPGTVNEYSGFFEIGVRKPNVIDHRFFRPSK